MAKCKYCGAVISRLDKEICPLCGGKKPLDGTDTTTQDITKVLGQVVNPKEIKQPSKIFAAILAFLFGFLGFHYFYLKKAKRGFTTLGISALFIGVIGTIIYIAGLSNIFAYLIPYFFIEVFMIVVGISYLVRTDITDGNGLFLK